MKTTSKKGTQGFTLIEMSVVVLIVLMLAMMALPNFQSSVSSAQVAAVQSQLGRMRTACDFYTFQHFENMPGHDNASGAWSEQILLNQLQMSSDEDGVTAIVGAGGFPFGPYLRDALPANPFNELTTILVVQPGATFVNPDDSTGWVYWADTGIFRINSTTVADDGTVVFEL